MTIEFAPKARAEYRELEPDELFEDVRDFLATLSRKARLPSSAELLSREDSLYRFRLSFEGNAADYSIVIVGQFTAQTVFVTRIRALI